MLLQLPYVDTFGRIAALAGRVGAGLRGAFNRLTGRAGRGGGRSSGS